MADVRRYAGLDDALAPMHEHLAGLVPIESDDGAIVERLTVEMPVELDVLRADEGGLSLGSSPPLYYQRTGFRSAPHHVRVTIVDERELLEPPVRGEGR